MLTSLNTIIGQTYGRQVCYPFGSTTSDRLFHTHIIGQTGTGKSTLLLNLMRQDISNRHGFCLIDPHGDLSSSIMKENLGNILYWDAASPSNQFGYNPLTPVSGEYRPLVASGLIDTLKKQWADAWGARMEHLLRFSLLALLEYPKSTLQDIIPMFLNKEFQRRVIANITDDYVRQFWTTEFETMKYKGAVDGVAPIANKLGGFLAHPVVRRSICEPEEPIRFRKIMDEGKVLVVNLSKGRLGADTANVLGGMILSNVAHAAYSRQNIPEASRKPFMLYVDEFHSFTTSAFADMLSELRKYALGLVLAHQHTSQVDKVVMDAIFGNVGTFMSFRIGANDAPLILKQLGENRLGTRELVNLPNYQMLIKLMINGEQSKAFSACTLPV